MIDLSDDLIQGILIFHETIYDKEPRYYLARLSSKFLNVFLNQCIFIFLSKLVFYWTTVLATSS